MNTDIQSINQSIHFIKLLKYFLFILPRH